MSLDLSTPLLPSPAPFSSPDFITTQPRKSPNNGSPSQMESPFVDRRTSHEPVKGFERRQFGSSHTNLSPAATELAIAIDQYKLENRRRYITCEEMLMVITKLGYSR